MSTMVRVLVLLVLVIEVGRHCVRSEHSTVETMSEYKKKVTKKK
jgi:hypothetical protein